MSDTRFQLRGYQRKAVDRTKAALPARPVLVAPTGSGKTVMGVSVVEESGCQTLWLAHRAELVDQAAERLRAYGLWTGIIMAGRQTDPLAPVQVASVQTLVNRCRPMAGLVVIDECHHATATTYADVLTGYPAAAVMGLTATPFRLDGNGLGDIFGEIVVAATTAELCEAGTLHRPRVYAASPPDLSGVKVTAGDYNARGAAQAMDTPEMSGDIIETWKKYAVGRRTVCFATTVHHSHDIARAFKAAGVPAEHLDGRTPKPMRTAILRRLAAGKTRVVSNCGVLTEGWDLPALECAIIARPTASLCLHLQMIGRVMRACPGKRGALVLDHAGNHHRHGLVTRGLAYDLAGTVRPTEPLGLRRCGGCGLFFEPSRFACPECGWVPEARTYAERETIPVHGEGELNLFDEGQEGSFGYRSKWWEHALMMAGYAISNARRSYRDRFGEWPVLAGGHLVDPPNATGDQKRTVHDDLLRIADFKGFKPGWAAYRYKDIFGVWPRTGAMTERRKDVLRSRLAGALT